MPVGQNKSRPAPITQPDPWPELRRLAHRYATDDLSAIYDQLGIPKSGLAYGNLWNAVIVEFVHDIHFDGHRPTDDDIAADMERYVDPNMHAADQGLPSDPEVRAELADLLTDMFVDLRDDALDWIRRDRP